MGALVRLLRADVETAVQTAAAASLSLLAAQDIVIQDSVRYLGGLDLLVGLLASHDSYLAEVRGAAPGFGGGGMDQGQVDGSGMGG